jgi:DNA-binding GntR family transcriptional regulator
MNGGAGMGFVDLSDNPTIDSLAVVRSLLNFPKILRTSMVEQVSDVLRAKILSGEIRPGAQLQEVSLARSLDVSRNTVREAMRTLSAEGLLRYSVHRGVSVPDLAVDDILEIFRLRRLFELAAVGHAAGLAPGEYAPFKAAIVAQKHAIAKGDWPSIVAHDMDFHRLLVGFLGSRRLSHFYWNIVSELRLALTALDRSSRGLSDIPAEHEKLIQHLAEGENAKATRLLEAHLAQTEQRLISTLQKRKTVQ